MEDLTVLVQLAGGERTHVRRLQDAGFVTAADLATQDSSAVSKASGLKPAAAQRLVKMAKQQLEEEPSGKNSSVQPGISHRKERSSRSSRPVKAGPPAAKIGMRAEKKRSPLPAGDEMNSSVLHLARADEGEEPGVSTDETLALTGEAAEESWFPSSFWRFG
ncbi:MAG: hypothetical protein ACE5ID_12985 [Acidobacteriota bacterium]